MWMDGMGWMVIIGHSSSESTFCANKTGASSYGWYHVSSWFSKSTQFSVNRKIISSFALRIKKLHSQGRLLHCLLVHHDISLVCSIFKSPKKLFTANYDLCCVCWVRSVLWVFIWWDRPPWWQRITFFHSRINYGGCRCRRILLPKKYCRAMC